MNDDDTFTAELYDDGSWTAYRRRGQFEKSYAGGTARTQITAHLAILWHTLRERRQSWSPS